MLRSIAAAAVVALIATVPASAQMKAQPAPPDANGTPTFQTAPAPSDSLESARRIARDEAIKLVKEKKAVWIDVRSKEQYDLGHIPGSKNIPLGELMNHLKELPSDKMIITYCA